MPDEIITMIISAITSAIISGITTLLLDIRKERRQDKKDQEKEKQKIHEERPELQIIKYEEYMDNPEQECDINVFMTRIEDVSVDEDVTAHYNKEFFNEKDWCCVIYAFKNVGRTDIRCVSPICTYQKDMVLCDVSIAQFILKHGILNYSTMYDRKIRVGESFTMKVCFHKEYMVTGMMSAIMVMVLEDSNGKFWEQPLFVPSDKIYETYQITCEEYRNQLTVDKAKECFREPWRW